MHLEAFTEGMLIATGRCGWWSGRWSRNRGGVHHSAEAVGEHQSVRIIRIAGDPQPALVMQPVMPRTQTSKIPSIRRAVAVVGIPVDDVMDMQELIRRAPRHPTPAVTQDHEAAGAFRHRPLGASDTDREPT